MGGSFSFYAKVARCAHKSRSEMMSPNTIDHYPRRERIVPTRNRAGKFETSTAALKRLRITPREYRHETTRHFVSRPIGIATQEDVWGYWNRLVDQRHWARRRGWVIFGA